MMYCLYETNHGIDGWDAKTKLVARFTSKEKAVAWLTARGFTYKSIMGYEHEKEARRHCMGQITYAIAEEEIPVDPT